MFVSLLLMGFFVNVCLFYFCLFYVGFYYYYFYFFIFIFLLLFVLIKVHLSLFNVYFILLIIQSRTDIIWFLIAFYCCLE